jgi:hypothetical protein
MRNHQLHSLAVRVLRIVYVWSERQYRREVLREALWRVDREMKVKRSRVGGVRRAAGPRGDRSTAARLRRDGPGGGGSGRPGTMVFPLDGVARRAMG